MLPEILRAATNAFVKNPATYKQLIFDDGCEARELNAREQEFVEHVCAMLGYDVEEIGG